MLFLIGLVNLNDTELYSEVIKHTPTPTHITQLALDFIKTKINGSISCAVHWRFDYNDWGRK